MRALALIFLLLATGARAGVDEALIRSGRPAPLLSDYGFFADGPAQRPAEGVHPYDLITPLFSDHALKLRFVHVPADGRAKFRGAHEVFDFPPGSALIKTFAYPPLAPGEAIRLIETRLLLRTDAGWTAWSYVWQDGDARLALAGARLPLVIDLPSGSRAGISYRVPNANQCKGCHSISGEIVPIGPKPRNLDHDRAWPEGRVNQLAHWRERGLIAGLPETPGIAAVVNWRDETAPLEARARAWLDINCAHCHRPQGPASNSGLFLEWEQTDPRALGIGKRPVAAGRGSGGRAFDIVPGDPDGSILLYRMESLDPGIMMPELGRTLVDEEALALVRDWITMMAPARGR